MFIIIQWLNKIGFHDRSASSFTFLLAFIQLFSFKKVVKILVIFTGFNTFCSFWSGSNWLNSTGNWNTSGKSQIKSCFYWHSSFCTDFHSRIKPLFRSVLMYADVCHHTLYFLRTILSLFILLLFHIITYWVYQLILSSFECKHVRNVHHCRLQLRFAEVMIYNCLNVSYDKSKKLPLS